MNDLDMEHLITNLQAPTVGERMMAIQALGKSRDARAIQPLITALSDDAVMLRTAAVNALTMMGEPATNDLITALQEGDDLLRTGAAKILGTIGGLKASEALQNALRDSNSRVRALAAEGLGAIADAKSVDVLIETLEDPDKQVVVRTVTTLGKLRAKQAVEPLIRLVKAHQDMIRHMAVWALGEIGDARAVPDILLALIEDCETHTIDFGLEINDLSSQHAHLMAGNDASGDSNRPDVEIAALVKIGQPALLPLLNILPKAKSSVRAYALMGIAAIDPTEGLMASTIAIEDTDRFVRHIATQIYRRLSPQQD
ncbi:MAG: HEAT repeat domain-containing protein [Chloroflexi bacterium]|nr:HEAT repeat domain-containing protein [Chloroflexota bacterium]